MSKPARDLLESFKQILWLEWDPIGVNQHAGASGEYDDYAVEALRLVTEGASCEAIAEYLIEIEGRWMGLGERSGAAARCRTVAQKLSSLNR